ncbi:hypothetical protein [Methylobacterium tarhaniae]|uniref:hypothetical protein n=1 Tax=Methylobacterium tarhaniae TaxID=1187852 RepID=UPI003CFF4B40
MSHQPAHDQFLSVAALQKQTFPDVCACGGASKLYISRKDVIETWYLINYANYLGYQLNVELVISWAAMGYTTWPAIDAAYSGLMDLMHKHVKGCKDKFGKPVPFLQYTVFENGLKFGAHSHTGLHLPRHDFVKFRHWLDKCIERINKTGVKNTCYCPVPRHDPTTSQWKMFSYAMKGMNPSLMIADMCGDYWHPGLTANYLLGVKQKYTGYIEFRRVRRSHAMSIRKLRAAGYVPSVDIWNATSSERYSDAEYRRGERDRMLAAYQAFFGSKPDF